MSFILLGILNSAAAGGGLPAPTAVFFGGSQLTNNTLERLDFNTEVRSIASATLSSSRRDVGNFSDAGVAGYFAGGYTGSVSVSTVDKLNFATETMATTTSLQVASRLVRGNLSNRAVAGYTNEATQQSFTKFAFPTDTRSYFSSGLPYQTNGGQSGGTNFSVAGYLVGGRFTAEQNDMAKLNYSTDTWSSILNRVSEPGPDNGVASNSGTSLFYKGTNTTNIREMSFATETYSLASILGTLANGSSGAGNVGVAGYFAGGDSSKTAIDRINFVTKTAIANYRQLNTGSYRHAAVENGGANV